MFAQSPLYSVKPYRKNFTSNNQDLTHLRTITSSEKPRFSIDNASIFSGHNTFLESLKNNLQDPIRKSQHVPVDRKKCNSNIESIMNQETQSILKGNRKLKKITGPMVRKMNGQIKKYEQMKKKVHETILFQEDGGSSASSG